MAELCEGSVVAGAPTVRDRHESERELIDACRGGDTHAWERLVAKYERLVYSIPLGYGLALDDAADITQLCFTSLFQSLDSLDDESRLAAWLATVAKRYTWRVLKRRNRRAWNGSDVSSPADMLVDLQARKRLERSELIDWLECGLSRLDGRCRDLLVALYFDPRLGTYSHTSEHLRIPVGSIGPMRARCLERLRNALDDVDEISDDGMCPSRTAEAAASQHGTRRPLRGT